MNKAPINVQDSFFYNLRKDNVVITVRLTSGEERMGRLRPPRRRLGSYCYTNEVLIAARQLKFLHSGAGTKFLRRQLRARGTLETT